MMKNLLNFSVIVALVGGSFSALAQEKSGPAPIFIQKYKQPKVTSRVPTVVQAQQNTSNTPPSKNKTSSFIDSPNPWSNTSFGRIKEEIEYYDKETRQYYNQYSYMGLLAQRGNQQELAKVTNHLQSNGVFNPQQYQKSMTNAMQGGPILGVTEEAIAARQAAATTPNTLGTAQTIAQPQAQQAKPKMVVKKDDGAIPSRIHQGYDDDMTDDQPQTTSKSNKQPIFLK